MKPAIFLAVAATLLVTASCGLSNKEKLAIEEAQRANDDSIRLAEIKQARYEDSLRTAWRDSLFGCNALLNREQTALIQLRSAIYTANDEMTQIKGFHFGRLPQERETEIQNQELKIQTLLLQQTNLQIAIQETMKQISHLKFELTAAPK